MAKPKVKEVIVVEGRYDKNTLSQVVDAVIVELGGFAVFNDKEKQAFLRKLAKERGLDNGYRVISNVGEDAGQTVKHLHFHVLGGEKLPV